MEKQNVWETYDADRLKELEHFTKEYMQFLDEGKTERECIDYIVNRIETEGYQELEAVRGAGRSLQAIRYTMSA